MNSDFMSESVEIGRNTWQQTFPVHLVRVYWIKHLCSSQDELPVLWWKHTGVKGSTQYKDIAVREGSVAAWEGERALSFCILFYFILLSFQVMPCSPGWPWIEDPPALSSWVLGLVASVNSPQLERDPGEAGKRPVLYSIWEDARCEDTRGKPSS